MIVGVDPGGRQTGVVARSGNDLLYAAVCTRETMGDLPDAAYLGEILDTISAAAGGTLLPPVAVEGLTHPNPHVGMANVMGLLGAAMVLGAVIGRWPGAVVVTPAGNGSGPLASYPTALCGPKEIKGKGKYRHVRSAWDVAKTGELFGTGEPK